MNGRDALKHKLGKNGVVFGERSLGLNSRGYKVRPQKVLALTCPFAGLMKREGALLMQKDHWLHFPLFPSRHLDIPGSIRVEWR